MAQINSYVTLEEANAYFGIRVEKQAWESLENKEAQLVSASDDFDALFPLKNDLNRKMREGGEIPESVKKAVCMLVIVNNDDGANQQTTKRIKIGPIEEEYQAIDTTQQNDPYSKIRAVLGNLMQSGNNLFVRVYR